MNFNEVVESRRSVRAYKADEKVSKEMVEELIKAAQLAPTWKNSQTGRYYVVMSDEKLTKVKQECLPEFNRNNCADAPVLIVTTFVKNRAGFNREGVAENELGNEWGAYDLGLQNENLLLKARDLGLDTLVMGIRDGEKLREILNIPEEQEVVAVISVGYRNQNPDMPKRKAVEDITVFY